MLIRVRLASLKQGRWYEWLVRFALGGLATIATGLLASKFGPAIGGLFLALPAVFCATATLVESHEKRRKRERGLEGAERGRRAAALDAAGASLGSVAMFAFAAVMALLVEQLTWPAFVCAALAWIIVAGAAWRMWHDWRH